MKERFRRRGGPGTAALHTPPALPPPPDLGEFFTSRCNEPITVHAQSELDENGNFADCWMLFGNDVLIVCRNDGGIWKSITELRTSQIQRLELHARSGATVVEAVIEPGERRRLLAFPDVRSQEFNAAVEAINARLNGDSETAFGMPALDRDPSDDTGKRQAFVRVFRFAHPYRFHLALILLFLMLSTLAGLSVPYMSKLFIDYILNKDPQTGGFPYAHYLPWAVLALLVVYLFQQAFGALQSRFAGYVGHSTVYDVRSALYEKLQELSLSFFDRHQTGTIIARINQDTNELRRLLVDFLPLSFESLFTLIGVGTLLFMLDWQTTLFVLIPISLVAPTMRYMMPRLHASFHRFFSRRSQLSAAVADSVSGMRVVKAFGQGDEELRKFDRFSSGYRDAGISMEYRWALYHPFMHFLIIMGTVVVWWVGGNAVIGGRMSVGSLVAYLGYLTMFYRPVFMLTRMFHMIVTCLSASERIFDILDAVPEVPDAPDAIPLPTLDGEIEFKNVTFGYDPHKPVVRNMSFHIRPNEIIGLVGKSGAGKSTIINLLARLYDADRGQVLVDGKNVRDVRHHDLRKHIGVVLQETFLFSGTIYDNIAYARPDASREEVIAAAEAANAHEFIIKKPDAYDTQVGERGNHLSGGEKQRISIARAILRNPRILILDEATSSVDTETEGKIQQALVKLTQGRTTLAIAHRLSTLRNCNRLLVIGDGCVQETGTHQELLDKGGVFADLVAAQRRQSEIIAVEG